MKAPERRQRGAAGSGGSAAATGWQQKPRSREAAGARHGPRLQPGTGLGGGLWVHFGLRFTYDLNE